MPNLINALKDEISRLARKEAKPALVALKKENIALKKTLTDFRKRLEALERNQKQMVKTAPQARKSILQKEEDGGRFWVSGKGIRAMRKKTGLSQADYATLLGVSTQTIVLWEGQDGRLKIRSHARNAIKANRGLGAREARRRLEELQADQGEAS